MEFKSEPKEIIDEPDSTMFEQNEASGEFDRFKMCCAIIYHEKKLWKTWIRKDGVT